MRADDQKLKRRRKDQPPARLSDAQQPQPGEERQIQACQTNLPGRELELKHQRLDQDVGREKRGGASFDASALPGHQQQASDIE